MIDSYIILNRKPKLIIQIFVINFFIIVGFVIWGINTFEYQTSFQTHSKILNFNSYYYLELLIPEEEVNTITNHNKMIMNNKEYIYHIHKINPNIVDVNNNNYQFVYLEIENLEEKYQKNGYQVEVKFLKEEKKIIDYIKE